MDTLRDCFPRPREGDLPRTWALCGRWKGMATGLWHHLPFPMLTAIYRSPVCSFSRPLESPASGLEPAPDRHTDLVPPFQAQLWQRMRRQSPRVGRRSLSAQWLTRNKSRCLGTGCHAHAGPESREWEAEVRVFCPVLTLGTSSECSAGLLGTVPWATGMAAFCCTSPCRLGVTDSPVPVYGGPAGAPPGKHRLQPKVPCCPARADNISVL